MPSPVWAGVPVKVSSEAAEDGSTAPTAMGAENAVLHADASPSTLKPAWSKLQAKNWSTDIEDRLRSCQGKGSRSAASAVAMLVFVGPELAGISAY